jgi:hypothetical protein
VVPPPRGGRVGRRAATARYFLNFDGLSSSQSVGGYYSGADGGPDYGIVFGPNAVGAIEAQRDGTWEFAYNPSPNTTFVFTTSEDAYITVNAGFTSLFFMYSDYEGTHVTECDRRRRRARNSAGWRQV